MNISKAINFVFYFLKPIVPRSLQIWLRRIVIIRKRKLYADVWPILRTSGVPPKGWGEWPEAKQFALVLTHDVDTRKGYEQCLRLVHLEKQLGFRSSFNFVPERYVVSVELRHRLTDNGFEVGVHGLKHDGKLYRSRKIFRERAVRINHYLQKWDAVGFRSPSMHHNLEWIDDLNIEYDASTFDTDPFEPQPDGVETIFPFFVQGGSRQKGYIELPYTLPQDFTLFVLMKETTIDVWKKKLDWIAERDGMALLNTHPDYMNFNGGKLGQEEYPVEYYAEFLQHVKLEYEGQYWQALPKDVARFCSNHLQIDFQLHENLFAYR